jgi:hypothetical protein
MATADQQPDAGVAGGTDDHELASEQVRQGQRGKTGFLMLLPDVAAAVAAAAGG